MIRQYELVESVKSYDTGADEDALNRAYVFSMKAHGSQLRASGDPYFSHPVEVAAILAKMKLDAASIITGLLHDTVEDTVATLADIRDLFGDDIARLVDGVTKLSQIELQSDESRQAENFRKLVLAMSEDIRVLLVKLADRLHNMRTLQYVKSEEKRQRIARETMDIYAPLAERIGIRDWKDELEDLAFRQLNPDAHASVTKRLDFLRSHGGDVIGRVIEDLRTTQAEAGVKAEVMGREKTPYSIWRKMQRNNVGFEQLSDIMAFRIAVESDVDCYRALGVIHNCYRVVPGRFKDYISIPKPNGYRSIHTGVIGPENQRIELQIRTREMHEVAEYGVAAHWVYKQGRPQTEGKQYHWLRQLLEILEHAAEPEEFLEHTKLEMFSDQVFCFSPKGDLYALPHGATPVDFAYAVHSEVGNHCVGAKINGRIVPLRTELRNGTGKTRACTRRFVPSQQRDQYVSLGREIVVKTFRQEGYELSEKALKGVLKNFDGDNVDDLYALVGEGQFTGREVLWAVFPGAKKDRSQKVVPLTKARNKAGKDHAVPIRGLIPGMAVHFAGCCHPLPGERIVGIVATGKGVSIHTIDCETLESFAEMPERWLDVSWEVGGEEAPMHVGRIHVLVNNEPGALGTISTVIGRDGGNIANLKIVHRSVDFFEMFIDIEVTDVKQLTDIMAALRATRVVNSVDRARG
jgi:GTP pyrophosphokinase